MAVKVNETFNTDDGRQLKVEYKDLPSGRGWKNIGVPSSFEGWVKFTGFPFAYSVKNLKQHCLNGPAVVNNDFSPLFIINDRPVNEKDYYSKVLKYLASHPKEMESRLREQLCYTQKQALDEAKRLRVPILKHKVSSLTQIPMDFVGVVEWDNGEVTWVKQQKYHRPDGVAVISNKLNINRVFIDGVEETSLTTSDKVNFLCAHLKKETSIGNKKKKSFVDKIKGNVEPYKARKVNVP